jgi:hypothetical protein
MRTVAIGAVLAVLGLAAAVGIGLAANAISDDSVGLSAQPLSAGDTLAPKESPKAGAPEKKRKPKSRPTRTTPTDTTEAPTTPTTAPAPEDNSGSGSDDSGSDNSGKGSSGSGSDDSGGGSDDNSGHGGGDDD